MKLFPKDKIRPDWYYILEYSPTVLWVYKIWGKKAFMKASLAKAFIKRHNLDRTKLDLVLGRKLKKIIESNEVKVGIKKYTERFDGTVYTYPDLYQPIYETKQDKKSYRTKLRRQLRGGKITEIKKRRQKRRKNSKTRKS
jgi:hypothetical protein